MANGRNGRQGVKISIIAEGKTEQVFFSHLRALLETHLAGKMPSIFSNIYNGRIPTGNALRKRVSQLLYGSNPSDHVIALTDVYTGPNQHDFINASDAKKKMKLWVGEEPRFHPHAAQFDFEAWLLPYWPRILELARHNQSAPDGNPEEVNHNNPPSLRIKEVFRRGQARGAYVKTRDVGRILRGQDLQVSIEQCSELKSLVNTVLSICGSQNIP